MEASQFWLNLPVKDIQKSRAFFKAIGFKENVRHKDAPHLASFYIGKQEVVMMLFPESDFEHFTQHPVTNTSKSAEILLNIDAQSPEEVDKMAELVKKAGGSIYAEPSENQGWMYVCGFTDPDGHRWCCLYMDESKMPG
ncbi:MAG: VOC family protein [Gillisia sp.]